MRSHQSPGLSAIPDCVNGRCGRRSTAWRRLVSSVRQIQKSSPHTSSVPIAVHRDGTLLSTDLSTGCRRCTPYPLTGCTQRSAGCRHCRNGVQALHPNLSITVQNPTSDSPTSPTARCHLFAAPATRGRVIRQRLASCGSTPTAPGAGDVPAAIPIQGHGRNSFHLRGSRSRRIPIEIGGNQVVENIGNAALTRRAFTTSEVAAQLGSTGNQVRTVPRGRRQPSSLTALPLSTG